jgi:hypothetical protein
MAICTGFPFDNPLSIQFAQNDPQAAREFRTAYDRYKNFDPRKDTFGASMQNIMHSFSDHSRKLYEPHVTDFTKTIMESLLVKVMKVKSLVDPYTSVSRGVRHDLEQKSDERDTDSNQKRIRMSTEAQRTEQPSFSSSSEICEGIEMKDEG